MSKQPKDILIWLFISVFVLQLVFSLRKEDPEGLIFWIIIITIVIIGGYASRRSDKTQRYWKLGLEKQINTHKDNSFKYISNYLGTERAHEIHGGDKIIDDNGFRICKKTLNNEHLMSDQKLKFYILIELSKFSLIQYQFDNAKRYLEKAVEIKPNSTIAIFKIAEASEYAGDKENALKAYKSIINLNKDDSHIKNYVFRQIERINQHGPKKPGPLGLKNMSY